MATTSELAERLENGWTVCDRAPPDKRMEYEDHWISLLRLYEAAHHRETQPTPNIEVHAHVTQAPLIKDK